MKNFTVDNSLKNLGKAVLWQYDKAIRLLSIMKYIQVMFFCSIEQFWARWMDRVLSIDTCGEFGCIVWSILLGVPRPLVEDEEGNLHQIAPSVYRRVLKGKYYLANATPSSDSIQGYLEIVFGIPGREAYSEWVVTQCEYGWHTNVEELNQNNRHRLEYHINHSYDRGEVFSFYKSVKDEESGQWHIVKQNYLVKNRITENDNTSFNAISSKIEETDSDADFSKEDDTILLKLYDPNGICRRIAGAPNDALSITAEYIVGGSSVTATISRRRRSGVSVIDDGDMAMHYEKTEFFSEMHKDQQALFEQRQDEICPYPLGIKTNAPVEEIVFGFEGQQTVLYEKNTAYAKGDIVGYIEGNGYNAFNWECRDNISAVENISFDAIRGKLKKTNRGDPIVGNIVDDDATSKIYKPGASIYFLTRDHRVSSPVVSFDKWPSLSLFFPPGSLCVPRTGAPVNMFPAWSSFPNQMIQGRVGLMDFVYKIPNDNNGMSTEVTDGSTYTAYFGDASGGQGAWNPYFMIITKKLADEYITFIREMNWNYFDMTSAIESEFRKTPMWLTRDYEKYGFLDAVGKAAKQFGWSPILLGSIISDVPCTSLICDSTLYRIGQGK